MFLRKSFIVIRWQGTEERNVCAGFIQTRRCMPKSRAFTGRGKASLKQVQTLNKSRVWQKPIRFHNRCAEPKGFFIGWKKMKWETWALGGGDVNEAVQLKSLTHQMRQGHTQHGNTLGFYGNSSFFPPISASTATLISISTPNLCVYKSSRNLEVTQSLCSSKDLCFRDTELEQSPRV